MKTTNHLINLSQILASICLAFVMNMSSLLFGQGFEIVAQLPASTPPGNLGIGPDGRIFMSVHEFYGQPLKMVEVLPDGSTKPYPTKAWAMAPTRHGSDGLYGVLGLNVASNGILWMLDTSAEDRSGRLIGWDTNQEKLHKIFYLAQPIIKPDSFLNDLAIDLTNEKVYIADTGTASIIVVDLESGRARRVLEGSKPTSPEDVDMIIDGRQVMLGGQPAKLGINPITIDSKNEYVYFGAMSGTAIYRVRTDDLNNVGLTDTQLEQRVERYGNKPISDGITIDDGGNVYVTSITDDSVGIVQTNGEYKQLFQRDDLSWTDGFAIGPNNFVYVTVNELHRSPVLNGGIDGSKGEFKIIRFPAVQPAQTGR